MEKGFPWICSLQDITQSNKLRYSADSLQMYFVYVYQFLKWFYLLKRIATAGSVSQPNSEVS